MNVHCHLVVDGWLLEISLRLEREKIEKKSSYVTEIIVVYGFLKNINGNLLHTANDY